jgi:tripartite-type tricarboxylate transporter receptor subunit TctC
LGLFAPSGTPKEIVAKLNSEVDRTLVQPSVRKAIESQDMEPATATPEELAALIRTGLSFWGKVIKDAGIRPIE